MWKVLKKSTIVVMLLSLSVVVIAPMAMAQQVYNANADYETGWVAGANPNGGWSYGWTQDLGGSITPYTRHYAPTDYNNYYLFEHIWNDPSNSNSFTPAVIKNSGGDINDGNITYQAGVLMLHPGGNDGHAYSHLIWTAPTTGSYMLNGQFFAQQQGINVDVHVTVNGTSILNDTITSNGVQRPFNGTYLLAAGAIIDFAVGPNGDYTLHAGSTGIDATITQLQVGGNATAMSTSQIECQNSTTQNKVFIRNGATSWDCVAAGLTVNPGDSIMMKINGTAY